MTVVVGNDPDEPVFAVDMGKAHEYIEELKRFPLRKRICICGHTVSVHSFDPVYGYSCSPGQIWCRCNYPVPVYCASDARFFMRSTHGAGMRHALSLGIAALTKKGGSGEWMMPLACAFKECRETEITVACVNENRQVVTQTTPTSVFLCRKHVLELGGRLL